MPVKTCPANKRNVVQCLKEHLPELDVLGINTFCQLERLLEGRSEDFDLSATAPVAPPERPVRMIHGGHAVKVPKPVVVVDE